MPAETIRIAIHSILRTPSSGNRSQPSLGRHILDENGRSRTGLDQEAVAGVVAAALKVHEPLIVVRDVIPLMTSGGAVIAITVRFTVPGTEETAEVSVEIPP